MQALSSDCRGYATEVATRLAKALTASPVAQPEGGRVFPGRLGRGQSLAAGAAGIAVLHGLRARAGDGRWATFDAWLQAAAREELSAGPAAGLWFGAPALAFTLAATAPSGHYRAARQRLDTTVASMIDRRLAAAHQRIDAGRRPERAEYDLVRGLTGLGAYLLTAHPGSEQLGRILAYLVRLTEPPAVGDSAGPALPGWWSSDIPTGEPMDVFADGHADLGMAHGIAGPLALLALAHRRGVIVPDHLTAMERICDWLDVWQQNSPSGPWWPEKLTFGGLAAVRPVQTGPGRASWCYGTPGLARAQQLAAIALADPRRQERAEAALALCLGDPDQLARFVDPAPCHGWAGLIATVHRAAGDAHFHPLSKQLDALTGRLLASLDKTEPVIGQRAGLIEGSAGVAAVLHSLTKDTPATWEAALLIDVSRTG